MAPDGIHVLDPLEWRAWGPFGSVEQANGFIEDDKYLSSCAVVYVGPFTPPPIYPPAAYHDAAPAVACRDPRPNRPAAKEAHMSTPATPTPVWERIAPGIHQIVGADIRVVADHPRVYPKVGWRVVANGAETPDTARTLRDAKPLAEARWRRAAAAVRTLTDQAAAAEQTLNRAVNALTEQHWRIAATLTREVVPDATGLRLDGEYTADGLRLTLIGVLCDDQPAPPLPAGRLDQLAEDLFDSLLWIAEHEDPKLLFGSHNHDLPAATLATTAAVAAMPLADGELRIFEPDPAEGDLGRMYVLDVHGVALLVRERPDGLYVHLDGDATSQAVTSALLVEVNNRGTKRYRL
jgi:hypothetical protein